jgi:hypothetical protein
MSGWTYFIVFVALAVGNVSYQLAGAQDWSAAFELSYFQGSALLVAWFVHWLNS